MVLSLQSPVSPILPKICVPPKSLSVIQQHTSFNLKPTLNIAIGKSQKRLLVRAVEESKESNDESETVSESANGGGKSGAELSELGTEIKKVLKERKEAKEGDLLSGVAEEIREIEWPAFGKVLGTTGVVLGVIAGSSVVLLTVNFVLAELSDRVFAGRGIQDFFG